MAGEGRLLVQVRINGGATLHPRLDVDLDLGTGITAVMGRSGAGKTTLLCAIAGLVTPDAGRIVLDGVPLFERDERIWVPSHRRRTAMVFQSLALFPHLSVWQNVAYGLRDVARKDRRQRAAAWLSRCRVEHVADRFPASLSGGEAQRVAIARALASEPLALLLDEPFSALDSRLRQDLGDELAGLVAELGIPAVLVTHHAQDATRLGSRLIELDAGRLVNAAATPAVSSARD